MQRLGIPRADACVTMAILFANNAKSILAADISSSATSMNVSAGDGSLFPSPTGGDYFIATIISTADQVTNEIVKVTARSSNTLTIVRAQEGTAAVSWPAGSYIRCLPTAGTMASFLQSVPSATTSAAGVVQLATAAEVNAGSNAAKAVTPATLAQRAATTALAGLIEIATSAEVTAGTDTSRAVVPADLATFVANAIGAISGGTQTLTDTGGANFPSWLLGGLQIRWGVVTVPITGAVGIQSFSFSSPFTNSCFACIPVCPKNAANNPASAGNNLTAICYGSGSNGQPSVSGGTFRTDTNGASTSLSSVAVFYIAVGH